MPSRSKFFLSSITSSLAGHIFCQLSVIFTGLISDTYWKELGLLLYDQNFYSVHTARLRYWSPSRQIPEMVPYGSYLSIHACILKSTQHTGIHKHTSILAVYKFSFSWSCWSIRFSSDIIPCIQHSLHILSLLLFSIRPVCIISPKNRHTR